MGRRRKPVRSERVGEAVQARLVENVMCPAEWISFCILEAGHPGPHLDWTDRPWTDSEADHGSR